MSIWRTKPISAKPENNLRRSLSMWDLTLLGVGAVIGAGIFVITGVAAATKAGPAISLSFVVAGMACFFSALVYAELASMFPLSGSAYTYAYVSLGEIIAWVMGWMLLLEYGISTAVVAIGWAGYVNRILSDAGFLLPQALRAGPWEGGSVNLMAGLVVLGASVVLSRGVRETSRVNNIVVMVKLFVILAFLALAAPHVEPRHWMPFMPFGWTGVLAGAGSIFFAYIGFDAVCTAAEEAKRPEKDVPWGLVLSLFICTTLYIAVALMLTGMIPYQELNVADPVAFALSHVGERLGSALVAAGAIAGLSSVIVVMLYGQSRIFFAMARDGLLPPFFCEVHPKYLAPTRPALAAGVGIALVAAFFPLEIVHKLVNIGTLATFIVVCVAVMVLRVRHPELPRVFRAPWMPMTPLLAIVFCLGLIAGLGWETLATFFAWMAVGLVIYWSYARKRSKLASS